MAFESFRKINNADLNQNTDLIEIFNQKTGLTGVINPIQIASPPSGVSGAIQFSNGSAFASDAANLFWDDTNKRLGIGTNAPSQLLSIGSTGKPGYITLARSSDGLPISQIYNNGFQLVINNGQDEIDIQNGGVSTIFVSNKRVNIGTGGVNLGNRVSIKGTGSTSATTSLLVQNSAGNNALIVTDDKTTRFAGICSVTPDTITGGTLFFQVKSGNWPTSLIEGYENGLLSIGSPTGTLKVGSTTILFKGTFSPDTTGGWGPINLTNQFAFNYSANFTNAGAGGTSEASLIQATGNTATSVGNVTLNQFAVKNTINNTGGTTTNRGFYYAPTLTSITNTTNIAFQSTSGSVNINTSTIQASAILQADSTTQGFLPPRMTNAQRLAIATPAVGLMVYQTDATEGLYIYKSTGWTFVI